MYQKIGLGLGKGLLWLWSVFLLLVSLGVFSMSVPGGIAVLLAAVVSNPLFLKLYNRYGKAGRMKAVTVVLSVVLLFVGVMFTPTKERTIEAQEQAASAMAEQKAADLSKEETVAAEAQESEPVLEEEKTEPEVIDPETVADETTAKGKEIADKAQTEDTAEDENADPDTLEVHFLDVGQGDCTLIRCGEATVSSTKEQSSAKAAASNTQSVQESKADVPVVTETQPPNEVQTPEQPQPEPEQPVVQEPAENSGSNFGEAHSNQFILNKNLGVLHNPSCSYLPKEKNQLLFNTVEEAMASPQYDHKCGHCW